MRPPAPTHATSSRARFSFSPETPIDNNNAFRGRSAQPGAAHPARPEDLFTASEFLHQTRPEEAEAGREPPGPDTLHRHRHQRQSATLTPAAEDSGRHAATHGTLDLVIAVPFTPNDKLDEPTIITDDGAGTATAPEVDSFRTGSRVPETEPAQRNRKHTVNGTVGGQFDASEMPPKDLLCPITNEVMRNPVFAPDGVTYEKDAIVDWLRQHGTSPVTRAPMTADALALDGTVQARVQEWRRRQREQRRRVKSLAKTPSDVQC